MRRLHLPRRPDLLRSPARLRWRSHATELRVETNRHGLGARELAPSSLRFRHQILPTLSGVTCARPYGLGEMAEITVEILPDGRLDAKNAATYLGLAAHTLAKKRCDGTGPKFVKRGRIFYYRDDLKAGRVSTTDQARRVRQAGRS